LSAEFSTAKRPSTVAIDGQAGFQGKDFVSIAMAAQIDDSIELNYPSQA
jgi:hypothetical protein